MPGGRADPEVPVDPTVDKFIMERRRQRTNLLAAEDTHPELFETIR